MPTAAPHLVLLIPATTSGFIVAALVALLSPFENALLLGLLAGLLCALIVALTLDRLSPKIVLRAISAEPLEPSEVPRLASLVMSLCASNGITEPALHVVESEALDAAVVGRPNSTHLVLTSGALRYLDRVELEAVVARELAQLSGGFHAATNLAAVGPLLGPLATKVRLRQLDPRSLALMDLQGVQMTRYPPALASALQKAATGDSVGATPATEHLWMVGDTVRTPKAQFTIRDRVDVLREL